MKRESLDRYREQLRALADRVSGTAASLEEHVRSPAGGEAGGGISNAPLHLGDIGSEVYAQELSAALLENEAYIRDEALAALERIDRGTYGRCERCHQNILAARLGAIPYTRYCVPCASALNEGRAVNLNDGRPAEWLGEPGHEGANQAGVVDRSVGHALATARDDTHAVGTPGGGTASGGLAGTNIGSGSPQGAHLEDALATGIADAPDDTDGEEEPEAFAEETGGAVGGTPANKRARGGKAKPASGKKATTTGTRQKKAGGAKAKPASNKKSKAKRTRK